MSTSTFDQILTVFVAECMCIASHIRNVAEAIKEMAKKANEMFSGMEASPENVALVKSVILRMTTHSN